MADLITLEEYKAFVGISPTNVKNDTRLTALIPAASRAVRAFTDRKFEITTGLASSRTYQYDGSGFLDIDDCSSITGVSTDAGTLSTTFDLDSTQWTAQPSAGEVYYYLLIHGGPFYSFSPEMGFERNLDQYEGHMSKPTFVTVTAVWGWPAIPADVKLATAWTVQDSMSKSESGDLSAESIEGFARTWAHAAAAGGGTAIPSKARDLLMNYQRAFG